MAVVRGLETHTALLRDIVPIPLDRRVVVGGQHREVLAQGNTGVPEEALRKGPRAVGIRHDLQVDLVVRADIRCINRKPLAHHLVVVRREGAIVAALENRRDRRRVHCGEARVHDLLREAVHHEEGQNAYAER